MNWQKVIIPALLSVLLFYFTGCMGKTMSNEEDQIEVYQQTIEEAQIVVDNSNLGLEFYSFSPVSEEDAASLYGDDHPESITTKDGYAKGYYFNYPWDSSDRRLTQILISGGDYDIFGIRLDEDISKVKPLLESLGYEQIENEYPYDDATAETYRKYHLYIRFITENDSTSIRQILVSTKEPNKPTTIS